MNYCLSIYALAQTGRLVGFANTECENNVDKHKITLALREEDRVQSLCQVILVCCLFVQCLLKNEAISTGHPTPI